jgi:2,3,4,5-tetrahydropyridine-2-carboxylate N-succinyltransferase
MNWEDVINQLEAGTLRSAYQENGKWFANTEVKQAILESFKAGKLVQDGPYVDKDTILPQKFTPERGIRIVPGGSSVRRGAYIAKGVIIMPPAYVNIGAYVDEGSMIDSHALVGSCAQIGKFVHLSAGVQIGGVLEPIGMAPVIIEDNVFVGAGSVIVEGIQVKKGAVISAGVSLSQGVPIYDCVNERILDKGESIPENAVVVPGSRKLNQKLEWGSSQGLHLNCAIIIKYRDEKSESSLELEEYLR